MSAPKLMTRKPPDFVLVQAQDMSPSDEEYITMELSRANLGRKKAPRHRSSPRRVESAPVRSPAEAKAQYDGQPSPRRRISDPAELERYHQANLELLHSLRNQLESMSERVDVRLDRLETSAGQDCRGRAPERREKKADSPTLRETLGCWSTSESDVDCAASCDGIHDENTHSSEELEEKLRELTRQLRCMGLDQGSSKMKHRARKSQRPQPESLDESDVDEIVGWIRSKPRKLRTNLH